MRGSKQRSITRGHSLKAQEQGAEAGSLIKRGRGRPRKDASLAFATQQGSAAGETKEEGTSGVQEGQLLRPSPNDNILSFKCSGCGKFYGTKASLSSHKYICKRKNRKLGPKQKRRFPCTVCGKHYGSKQYLKIHLKHSHSESKEPQNKRTISKGDVVNDDSDTKRKKTESRAATARVIKVIIHLHFAFSL